MEQITRDKFPSNGGWKFRQPQLGNWENNMAMVGFDASVKNIISSRKKNRAATIKHRLSTDYDSVSKELIRYNELIRNAIPKSAPKSLPRPDIKLPPMGDRVMDLMTKTISRTWKRMSGRICITTTFDRNYALAGKTLFKSIRHYTDCRGVDFKVITSDDEVLSEFGKESCHFVDATIRDRYKNVAYSPQLPQDKYHNSWYRYELFNFDGYERVICIDSDCLCLNDISYLFSDELNSWDIVSVEDHIVSKCFTKYVPELERQGLNFVTLNERRSKGQVDIQPALIVANKNVVNNQWYSRLLEYANTTSFTYSIDEGILNDFIYKDGLRIRLLPIEYDYQDLYEMHIGELPAPRRPVIVHCQESKPFKKSKDSLDSRMHKWHDRWWYETNFKPKKTIIVIMVYNRFENVRLWLNAWKKCNQANCELVVVHNLDSQSQRFRQICDEHGVKYVARRNMGFDIGAFQDVCRGRLDGFPLDWDNIIWIADDCLPLEPNFVPMFLCKLEQGYVPCYEISDQIKRHVRTTGFLVTRDIASRLTFPADPITTRDHCYEFEHRGFNMYEQIIKMNLSPLMIESDLRRSPLWDSSWWSSLNLMSKHHAAFASA